MGAVLTKDSKIDFLDDNIWKHFCALRAHWTKGLNKQDLNNRVRRTNGRFTCPYSPLLFKTRRMLISSWSLPCQAERANRRCFPKRFSRLSVYTILYTMNYRKELSECILQLASQAQLEDQRLCLIQTICFKHAFSKSNSTNVLIKVSIIITTFLSIFDSHFFQIFSNFLLSKRITKLTNETKCHNC